MENISTGEEQKGLTPVLKHGSYDLLCLSNRYMYYIYNIYIIYIWWDTSYGEYSLASTTLQQLPFVSYRRFRARNIDYRFSPLDVLPDVFYLGHSANPFARLYPTAMRYLYILFELEYTN